MGAEVVSSVPLRGFRRFRSPSDRAPSRRRVCRYRNARRKGGIGDRATRGGNGGGRSRAGAAGAGAGGAAHVSDTLRAQR